jgi:uncharacterized protein YqgC (DUF456 family)
MNGIGELCIGLLMACGLVGIVVPVVPGILLVWATGLAWTILDGGGTTRWVLFFLMSVLMAIGLVSQIGMPAKELSNQQAPKWTLVWAGILGIIGFFIIPIVGLPIGFTAGVFLRYMFATNDLHVSMDSTWLTVRAIGKGILIQGVCGLGIAFLWFIGLLVT